MDLIFSRLITNCPSRLPPVNVDVDEYECQCVRVCGCDCACGIATTRHEKHFGPRPKYLKLQIKWQRTGRRRRRRQAKTAQMSKGVGKWGERRSGPPKGNFNFPLLRSSSAIIERKQKGKETKLTLRLQQILSSGELFRPSVRRIEIYVHVYACISI